MEIGRKAIDGREICVGDLVGVDKFDTNGYYFVVLVEGARQFKLIFDYDISPSSSEWTDYEDADNVLADKRKLYILDPAEAYKYKTAYDNYEPHMTSLDKLLEGVKCPVPGCGDEECFAVAIRNFFKKSRKELLDEIVKNLEGSKVSEDWSDNDGDPDIRREAAGANVGTRRAIRIVETFKETQ